MTEEAVSSVGMQAQVLKQEEPSQKSGKSQISESGKTVEKQEIVRDESSN